MGDTPQKGKRIKGKGHKVVVKFTPTHVLVGFEGFNAPLVENAGEELPMDTPDNRVVDILNKSTEGLGDKAKKQAYSTDMFEVARDKAAAFIRKNLKVVDGKQRGKLIVYGYSMGGDTAVELANELKGEFTIDLLITVDGATGGNIGVDREIPDNVVRNVNFWTKTPGTSFGQSGGDNTAVNPKVTLVQNIPLEGESHGSIYKASKEKAIALIEKELASTKFSPVHKPFMLTFNGKELKVVALSDRSVEATYPAMSGLPAGHKHLRELIAGGRTDLNIATDYTKPQFQNVKDAGPIPEDTYELPLNADMEFQKTSAQGLGWGVGGWRLNGGFWNDVAMSLFEGRGGFYLHNDGAGPGTAGCIGVSNASDVMSLRERFKEAFAHGQNEVEVQVAYPVQP